MQDPLETAYNGGVDDPPHKPPEPNEGSAFVWGLLAVLVTVLLVWWL